MIFGGVFEKFPKLKVCFAHGGGSFPYTVGRIEHGFQVRPDLCAVDNKINPRKYLGNFYTDSLVHDPLRSQATGGSNWEGQDYVGNRLSISTGGTTAWSTYRVDG
uniref:2-amino-3-carboxymuconate-6-semialdehyde decarboxylase n=1 Tax=Anguilla anguilla TaxID=7936 RepID=A0A0E9WLK4_ANGAN